MSIDRYAFGDDQLARERAETKRKLRIAHNERLLGISDETIVAFPNSSTLFAMKLHPQDEYFKNQNNRFDDSSDDSADDNSSEDENNNRIVSSFISLFDNSDENQSEKVKPVEMMEYKL